jgi:hypothetical protein
VASKAQHPSELNTTSDEQREAFIETFGGDYLKGFQDPLIFKYVSFFNTSVRQQYRHDFKVLSRCLFAEYIYRRRPDFNQEVLDHFSKLVGAKLADIKKLLTLNTTRVEQLLAQNGFAADGAYVSCQNKLVPIIHAASAQYLDILQLLDKLFQTTGSAVLYGVLTADQRKEAELKCKKAVRAFASMVRAESINVRKEAQRLASANPDAVELKQALDMHEEAVAQSAEPSDSDEAAERGLAIVGSPQAELEGLVATGVAAGKQSKADAQPQASAAAPESAAVVPA